MSGLVSVNTLVALKARLVKQFMGHHLFRYLEYYQATQSTRPPLFSYLIPVTIADSH